MPYIPESSSIVFNFGVLQIFLTTLFNIGRLQNEPRSKNSRHLTAKFRPKQTGRYQPNSHQHAGHSSSPETGESHYHIIISSQKFQSKSRVEIHRMINKLLKEEEFDQGLHALSIEASA